MKKLKIKKINIILISAILLNIIMVSLYFALWLFVSKTSDNISFMFEIVSAETNKNNEKYVLAVFMDQTKNEREKVEKLFISNNNFINFVEQIEDVAKRAKVEIVNHSLPKSDNWLILNYSVTGSFNGVLYFVGLVEKLPYNLRVDNINMVFDSDKNLWGGNIEIIVSSFKG